MPLVITGSEGNVGRRLIQAFPGSIGIDRHPDADIVVDMAKADWSSGPLAEALANADGLIHLATSPDPSGPPELHFSAATSTARLVEACARIPVPRLVLASSDWAEPKSISQQMNTYGRSKQVIEALAAMYQTATNCPAVALRIGWIPREKAEVAAAEAWLQANYWPDERLIAEFEKALAASV